MGPDLLDCPWCGSAQSIEHDLCQVCLMEFDVDTKVIQLPPPRTIQGHPAGSRLPRTTDTASELAGSE